MLDPKGRLEIIQVVREIKEQYGLTVISITHDLDEASLSDKIIVMRGWQDRADCDPRCLVFES
jgi:energy-coupling factor transport system ATP-binding protein